MPLTMTNSQNTDSCIDECIICHQTCLQAAMGHCLETGGKHVEPGHFRLMMSCAEICQTSANFMLSDSPFSQQICRSLRRDLRRLCGKLREAGGHGGMRNGLPRLRRKLPQYGGRHRIIDARMVEASASSRGANFTPPQKITLPQVFLGIRRLCGGTTTLLSGRNASAGRC